MKLNPVFLLAIAGAALVSGSARGGPAGMPVVTRTVPGAMFSVPVSSAGLVWDSDMKATNVMAGESAACFTFNFTNVSASSITVLGVHPSCGCTTAQMPPLPWKIASGTNGQIGITVNIAGKSGTLLKTVNIVTEGGSKLISLKITVLPSTRPELSADVRVHNLALAQADRQAVFRGDCADCHVKPGGNKLGRELYDADCAICHEGGHRATMVPDLHTLSQTTTIEFWRTWIAYGRPHSLMPAFAIGEGGPLTDTQITSLADFIMAAIPSKSAGN